MVDAYSPPDAGATQAQIAVVQIRIIVGDEPPETAFETASNPPGGDVFGNLLDPLRTQLAIWGRKNMPISRAFMSGANRDRTGDLLLANWAAVVIGGHHWASMAGPRTPATTRRSRALVAACPQPPTRRPAFGDFRDSRWPGRGPACGPAFSSPRCSRRARIARRRPRCRAAPPGITSRLVRCRSRTHSARPGRAIAPATIAAAQGRWPVRPTLAARPLASARIVAWGRELDTRPITTASELTDASEGASRTDRHADVPQTCQTAVVD